MSGPLPKGWTEKIDHNGKKFYIHEADQIVTWRDPRPPISYPNVQDPLPYSNQQDTIFLVGGTEVSSKQLQDSSILPLLEHQHSSQKKQSPQPIQDNLLLTKAYSPPPQQQLNYAQLPPGKNTPSQLAYQPQPQHPNQSQLPPGQNIPSPPHANQNPQSLASYQSQPQHQNKPQSPPQFTTQQQQLSYQDGILSYSNQPSSYQQTPYQSSYQNQQPLYANQNQQTPYQNQNQQPPHPNQNQQPPHPNQIQQTSYPNQNQQQPYPNQTHPNQNQQPSYQNQTHPNQNQQPSYPNQNQQPPYQNPNLQSTYKNQQSPHQNQPPSYQNQQPYYQSQQFNSQTADIQYSPQQLRQGSFHDNNQMHQFNQTQSSQNQTPPTTASDYSSKRNSVINKSKGLFQKIKSSMKSIGQEKSRPTSFRGGYGAPINQPPANGPIGYPQSGSITGPSSYVGQQSYLAGYKQGQLVQQPLAGAPVPLPTYVAAPLIVQQYQGTHPILQEQNKSLPAESSHGNQYPYLQTPLQQGSQGVRYYPSVDSQSQAIPPERRDSLLYQGPQAQVNGSLPYYPPPPEIPSVRTVYDAPRDDTKHDKDGQNVGDHGPLSIVAPPSLSEENIHPSANPMTPKSEDQSEQSEPQCLPSEGFDTAQYPSPPSESFNDNKIDALKNVNDVIKEEEEDDDDKPLQVYKNEEDEDEDDEDSKPLQAYVLKSPETSKQEVQKDLHPLQMRRPPSFELKKDGEQDEEHKERDNDEYPPQTHVLQSSDKKQESDYKEEYSLHPMQMRAPPSSASPSDLNLPKVKEQLSSYSPPDTTYLNKQDQHSNSADSQIHISGSDHYPQSGSGPIPHKVEAESKIPQNNPSDSFTSSAAAQDNMIVQKPVENSSSQSLQFYPSSSSLIASQQIQPPRDAIQYFASNYPKRQLQDNPSPSPGKHSSVPPITQNTPLVPNQISSYQQSPQVGTQYSPPSGKQYNYPAHQSAYNSTPNSGGYYQAPVPVSGPPHYQIKDTPLPLLPQQKHTGQNGQDISLYQSNSEAETAKTSSDNPSLMESKSAGQGLQFYPNQQQYPQQTSQLQQDQNTRAYSTPTTKQQAPQTPNYSYATKDQSQNVPLTPQQWPYTTEFYASVAQNNIRQHPQKSDYSPPSEIQPLCISRNNSSSRNQGGDIESVLSSEKKNTAQKHASQQEVEEEMNKLITLIRQGPEIDVAPFQPQIQPQQYYQSPLLQQYQQPPPPKQQPTNQERNYYPTYQELNYYNSRSVNQAWGTETPFVADQRNSAPYDPMQRSNISGTGHPLQFGVIPANEQVSDYKPHPLQTQQPPGPPFHDTNDFQQGFQGGYNDQADYRTYTTNMAGGGPNRPLGSRQGQGQIPKATLQ